MYSERPLTRSLTQLQCPRCGGALSASADQVSCRHCGASYELVDGNIIDFVKGDAATQLDADDYDNFHAIVEARSFDYYEHTRQLLGERWPASLGSTLEIGCGTGFFSRALVARAVLSDIVLTDVSVDMLKICHAHLDRGGLLSRAPISFATYSTMDQCFQADSFDTVIGMQVLHHLPDVPQFLAELLRILKPGGRAFFAEPARPFQQAVALALADLIAILLGRGEPYSDDRQALHNWIAQQRLSILHQRDKEFLLGLEDKHMFVGSEFERTASQLGFATVETLPTDYDPSGLKMISGLMGQLRINRAFADEMLGLLPSITAPHMGLLAAKDQSASYLFWLQAPTQKRNGPVNTLDDVTPHNANLDDQIGSASKDRLPPRCSIEVATELDKNALKVTVNGWCLMTQDIRWLRFRVNEFVHQRPVWLPSADVHLAYNPHGTYANWNSLCCRVLGTFCVPGALLPAGTFWFTVQAVMMDDTIVDLMLPRPVRAGEQLHVAM